MEEPIVMSPEQLWAVNDEEIEQFRGEDHEITEFDHKISRDMREFANYVKKNNVEFDNVVRIHGRGEAEDDEEEEENERFYDYVPITRI